MIVSATPLKRAHSHLVWMVRFFAFAALTAGASLLAAPVALAAEGQPSGTIIYNRYDPEKLNSKAALYAINADGSGKRRLPSCIPDGGAWSRDGKKIAYSQSRGKRNEGEIYVMNADCSKRRRIARPGADDGSPAWSPDGTRIAFVSSRKYHVPDNEDPLDGVYWRHDIYVMYADGSGVRRVTHVNGTDDPTWSPDGTKIAFVRREPNEGRYGDLYVINADGSAMAQLTSGDDDDAAAGWSPDGAKIAYESESAADETDDSVNHLNSDIFLINPDGSGKVQLTSGPADDDYPTWSPDGNWIALVSTRGKHYYLDNRDIYITAADGSGRRNLTRNPKNHDSDLLAWLPG